MIIPLRSPDGLPDVTRLHEWTAVCDHCEASKPVGACSTWLIPRASDWAVYCPPCVFTLAAELIRQVGSRRLGSQFRDAFQWFLDAMRGGR